MPENPGNYKPIPPVTTITKVGGVVKIATNVGAAPHINATPTAMADPAQAARIVADMQRRTAVVAAQQNSDPHSGRVIFKDITLVGGIPYPLAHGLGRAFVGWAWNRPRTNAPTIVELAATTAKPATLFLLVQSGVNCTVDIEVW